MTQMESIEKEFTQGNHAKILANTIDVPSFQIDQDNLVYIVGSLVFLGRMDEAEITLQASWDELSIETKIEARFYMAIGFTRQWKFAIARRYLVENALTGRRLQAKERFFIFQGFAFYHFMACRYRKSLDYAQKSYREALRARYFYGRALATDLQGHTQFAVGDVFKGIQALERAHEYFTLLHNYDHMQSIARSLVSGKARHSIDLEENFAILQQLAHEEHQEENNYSLAGSYLNICRLYCLTGQISEAEKLLNQAAEIIQKSSHQRYAVLLNFRRAYCAYLRGQAKALNYLQSIPENAIQPADLRTRMQFLGLELNIKKAMNEAFSPEKMQQLQDLTRKSGYGIGRRILTRQEQKRTETWGRDPFGDFLDEVFDQSLAVEEKVELIQKHGYWSFIYDLLPVSRASRILAVNLLPGLIVVLNHGDVCAQKVNQSSQLIKFLHLISHKSKTKQELIQAIWGYEYHPIRHDSLIYGLLSRVRSLLGECHNWIISEEDAYRLQDDVQILFHQPTDTVKIARSPEQESELDALPSEVSEEMNQRHYKILRHLEQHEFINLKICQDLFADVSKVTLSRDLSFLVDKKLLMRTGKGRNTCYMKSMPSPRAEHGVSPIA
ncbi:MAG: hypothetical protein ACOH5I_07120 [Oligoflexus sp.]